MNIDKDIQNLIDLYFKSNQNNLTISREKVREELTEKLHEIFKTLNYNYDTSDSSFSQLLINLFSAVIGDMVSLSNFLYGESTLVTAQMYESIYNWAKMLDYEPVLAKPAVVTLQAMFPFEQSFSYILQPFETYFVANNIPFTPVDKIEIIREYDYTNNQPITIRRYYYKNGLLTTENVKYYIITSVDGQKKIVFNFSAINLYTKELNFVSDNYSSYSNYEYTVELEQDEYLNELEVYVNGEKYKRGNLKLASSTDTVYDIIFKDKNSFIIRFGNNVQGKGIAPGSTIYLKLYVTNGSKGNIQKLALNNQYSDNTDYGIVEYTILNVSDGTGGVDNLSEEEIKYNTIVDLRTRKRIVTLDDYSDFVRQYKFVDKFKILQKESDNRTNDIYLYVSLKDENGNIIPTETISIDYEELKFKLSTKVSGQGYIQIVTKDDVVTKFEFNSTTQNQNTYKIPGYLFIDLVKYTWYLIPFEKILLDYKIISFTQDDRLGSVKLAVYLYSDNFGYNLDFEFNYEQDDVVVQDIFNNNIKKLLLVNRNSLTTYTSKNQSYTTDKQGNRVFILSFSIPFNELSLFTNKTDIRLEFIDNIYSKVNYSVVVLLNSLFYDYGPIYSYKRKLLLLDIPVVNSDYDNVNYVMKRFKELSDTFNLSTRNRMLNHKTHIKFLKTQGTVRNNHFSKPDYFVNEIIT